MPRCFKCGEVGHILHACPLNVEAMDCSVTVAERYGALSTPLSVPNVGVVLVNGHSVLALFDTGSNITIVARRFVLPRQWLKQHVRITCVQGETRAYRSAKCFITWKREISQLSVAVLPEPPFPVILGHDWSKTKSGKIKFTPVANLGLTMGGRGALPAAPTPCNAANTDDVGRRGEESQATDPNPETPGEGPSRAPDNFPAADDPLGCVDLQFRSTSASFKREQWNDDSLKFTRNAIVSVDGHLSVSPLPLEPYFVLDNDLLYRVATHEGKVWKLLLVPRTYRRQDCELAHAHLLGAHLGAEKTLERIKLRFYWPGINEEVRRFCQSCPDCQIRQIPRRVRAPLVPIPLVDIPFERLGVDIVGPLKPSSRGFKYILVMVEYATRYPEAVPLRSANTKNIARELVNLFSRVGIPKEVLTDQGTPFTSDTFREVARLLRISHLKTSVYHPQTDGLVERFNQTLKQMLRKVVSADGRNWDQLLPLVLFAYWEVPQASTGFSPFELLYGHQPRGLLDMLKEGWEAEPLPSNNVLEYIAQLRDRLEHIRPLLKEHMMRVQSAQARVIISTPSSGNSSPGTG
uniref:Gypsy retrotransposon integrase-like protein 1 n=1 Tax=Erpetoichthys calabaricus TaxID=27687 RepID=A0A8C4X6A1_ERPCA